MKTHRHANSNKIMPGKRGRGLRGRKTRKFFRGGTVL